MSRVFDDEEKIERGATVSLFLSILALSEGRFSSLSFHFMRPRRAKLRRRQKGEWQAKTARSRCRNLRKFTENPASTR
jgi:hypothetical protein